ncbi:MAG: hypothetical protein MZV64_26925 [Ignavibacteriales bacterium]|nr:hypothetical protein [Ignavibacteriales bacterium]
MFGLIFRKKIIGAVRGPEVMDNLEKLNKHITELGNKVKKSLKKSGC